MLPPKRPWCSEYCLPWRSIAGYFPRRRLRWRATQRCSHPWRWAIRTATSTRGQDDQAREYQARPEVMTSPGTPFRRGFEPFPSRRETSGSGGQLEVCHTCSIVKSPGLAFEKGLQMTWPRGRQPVFWEGPKTERPRGRIALITGFEAGCQRRAKLFTAFPHLPAFRFRKRCTLKRFPQACMSHQRRMPLRLVSRKNQVQFSPAHCRTRWRRFEVSKLTAERVISPQTRCSEAPRSSQVISNRLPALRRLAAAIASLKCRFSCRSASGRTICPIAILEKT